VNPGNDDPKKAWYLSRDHAWFAAYSPAKAPEISVVVLVEHGGSGPTVAAPVAMQVIKEYHRLQANRASKLGTKHDTAAATKPAPAPPPREPAPADPNALPPDVKDIKDREPPLAPSATPSDDDKDKP